MTNPRNYNFDLLRFVILYMLVVFHFIVDIPGFLELKSFLSYALPGFFSLSGYLIHSQLVESDFSLRKVLAFYYRRALRIMPAYYLVLILASATYSIEYLGWIWAYLLNIRLFIASFSTSEIIEYMERWKENGIHYWSMGIEEQFYLVYPWFLWGVGLRYRLWGLTGLILFSIAIREWFIAYTPHTFYGALFPVAGEYILWGALAAELSRRGQLPRFRFDFVFWAAAFAVSAWYLGQVLDAAEIVQLRPTHWLTIVAATLAAMVNSLSHSLRKTALTSPFIYVGRISYGIYLVHVFLIVPFRSFMAPWSLPLAAETALFCIFVTVIGSLIWELIDSPLQKFRHRFEPEPK